MKDIDRHSLFGANSIIFGYNITTTQDYELAFNAGPNMVGRVIMTPEEHAVITKMLERVEITETQN